MVAEKLATRSFSSPQGSLPHCRLLAGSIHPEDSALHSMEGGWTNNPLWKITGYIYVWNNCVQKKISIDPCNPTFFLWCTARIEKVDPPKRQIIRIVSPYTNPFFRKEVWCHHGWQVLGPSDSKCDFTGGDVLRIGIL